LTLYDTYTWGGGILINNKIMNNQKTKTLINFKKAHSLLAKIIKMSEEKAYCINIMQQNLAVIGLLKSANQQLLEGHLNSCFKNVMASKNDAMKKKMIEEILKVSKLTNK
jgi:DNA-binding FrmR family transcriptional regulator